MLQSVMKSVFGSSNDRYVKSLHKIVAQINDLEPAMQALSDEDLQAQTPKLRERLSAGANDAASLSCCQLWDSNMKLS